LIDEKEVYVPLCQEDVGKSSTFRELKGLISVVEKEIQYLIGKNVHVRMDSAPAISNLFREGGSKKDLVQLIKIWWKLCKTHRLTPNYEWVPREELSYVDRISKTHELIALTHRTKLTLETWSNTK